MKRLILFLVALISLSSSTLYAQSQHKYLTLDMQKMEQRLESIKSSEHRSTEYLSELIHLSEAAYNKGPYSVVSKAAVPPSGDKHDYISMGPYWWPDPEKEDGLPYINRDGQINPERNKYTDNQNLSSVCKAINLLGEAYYFTQDEKYVEWSHELLNVFFIAPETKMNPNLKYGQFVPGLCEGRGIGIIETAGLTGMLEGIALLSDSDNWSKEIDKGMKSWIKGYSDWLTEHQYGIDERNAKNNHGTHYDAQYLSMLIYLDEVAQARKYIDKYTKPRLRDQVAKDGCQSREISRTKSWNYSNMNLHGFVEIAQMADKIGVDLWNYQKGGQVYIKSMIDWFVPYILKEKEWNTKQIAKSSVTRIQPVLELAAEVYGDASYLELIESFQTIHPNITH